MNIISTSHLASTADERGNAQDNGALLIRYIEEDGRQMEETRRYRLDGKVLVTTRDVVAGTETTRLVDDPATLGTV